MELHELQSPDWGHWKKLNQVTLWQAIQLSMNVCPNNYTPGIGICAIADQRFWSAQLICHEWIRTKRVDWVTHSGPYVLDSQWIFVDLPKFVVWFSEVIGSINSPDEFKRLHADGYNNGAKLSPSQYVPIARNIAKHFIDEQSSSYKLTQATLAKKIAKEFGLLGLRGVNGGVISYDTIRTEALTADNWFQRFKPNPNQ